LAKHRSTTTTAAGRSAGRSATRRVNASTPPADAPIAMRRSAERSRSWRRSTRFGAMQRRAGPCATTCRPVAKSTSKSNAF